VVDGAAALAALETAARAGTPFALAVLDMQMPGMDGFELLERVRAAPAFGSLPVLVLSSAGEASDTERCRRLGVAAYLMKPATQSDLWDAVMTGLSGSPESIEGDTDERPAGLAPGIRPLHVLLAEDNPINQTLAARMLGRQGHTVVVAGNGVEALEALRGERFDVVLMDVQMPEMDGFEATATIRAEEQATGRRIPILAMTAHAMPGDEARCLAAGMDGYLAKPVRPEALAGALARFVGAPAGSPPASPVEPGPASPLAPLDVAQALALCEGDV